MYNSFLIQELHLNVYAKIITIALPDKKNNSHCIESTRLGFRSYSAQRLMRLKRSD